MKKVLFGICALAISASAFGAIMSNGTIAGTGTTSVTLPIKLEANIVNGANKLFIEGTSGDTFGDVLSLNFGDLAHGQIGKTEGRVKVFRGDTWNASKFEPTKLGGTVSFSFITDGSPSGKEAEIDEYYQLEMNNTTIGGATGTATNVPINVGIGVTNIFFDGATIEESTKVEARVAALTQKIPNTQAEGKYYGAASIVAELEIQ